MNSSRILIIISLIADNNKDFLTLTSIYKLYNIYCDLFYYVILTADCSYILLLTHETCFQSCLRTIVVSWIVKGKINKVRSFFIMCLLMVTGFAHLSSIKIPGLFQDFPGPYLQKSRTRNSQENRNNLNKPTN